MAKQGGKGKQSSQSDRNYWARLKSAGGMTSRKAARVKAAAKTAKTIDYGKSEKSRPIERVVFSGTVSANYPAWGIPPIFIISDGKTIDVVPRESDAMQTFRDRCPGPFCRVVTGENIPRVLASSFR